MVLAQRRLRTQHLVGPGLATPLDVVRWLGAVQAQDPVGAAWGIAQRTRSGALAEVAAAYASGAIVRTHVLRPTWHFVAVEDLRWMLALSAPRIQAQNASFYRQGELDARTLRRGDAVIVRALEAGPRTRPELAAALGAARLGSSGLRLAAQLMHAELGALIASGPMRGKLHTYARVDAIAPRGPTLARDEALATIAIRYATGHGPIQLDDLAWWAGLTRADARAALALAGSALVHERIGDRSYYAAPSAPTPTRRRGPTAHLLPNYDEYVVAYKDRSAHHDAARLAGQRAPGVLEGHLIIVDGLLVGGWGQRIARGDVAVTSRLLIEPTAAEARALAAAITRYRAAIRSSAAA